jgi:predicted MFS family arabinose efflux permease
VAIGALLLVTLGGVTDIWPIYVVLFVIAVSRAFFWPAQQSLAPNLVPQVHLATTIAASSAIWQTASISAPLVGGLLYDWLGIEGAQAVAMSLAALAALCVLPIPKAARRVQTPGASLEAVIAGFRYIWRAKVVLGAISLDLFAVLLGGAAMLLPVFAKDILEVGPEGLGLLRAAGGAGALCTALWLAWRPIRDHAGVIMFACVIAYGAFTVVFGYSTTLWLSVAALFLMGAADMVSVYVRGTLIQLRTPDEVRGRVNAVNMVFIGASNELGGFRAGTMAAWIGTVPAVVVGGVGTVLVGLGWLFLFPELRRERRLDGKSPAPVPVAEEAPLDRSPGT